MVSSATAGDCSQAGRYREDAFGQSPTGAEVEALPCRRTPHERCGIRMHLATQGHPVQASRDREGSPGSLSGVVIRQS
jgi:hypothetical protein